MPIQKTSILGYPGRAIAAVTRYVNNSEVMQKFSNASANSETAGKMMTATIIGSICAKDFIGCLMYVWQSFTNDKIPKEKRNFVAALDATNGILMIVAQLAIFAAFQKGKVAQRLFDFMTKKTFSNQNLKQIGTSLRIDEKMGRVVGDTSQEAIESLVETRKKAAIKIFERIVDIAAATIVAKRIIVPLVATPLAGTLKEKVLDRLEKKNAATSTDGQEPSVEEAQRIVMLPESKGNVEQEFKGNLLERYKANAK